MGLRRAGSGFACVEKHLKLTVTCWQKRENLLLLGECGGVALLFYLTNERHYNYGETCPSVEVVILKTITLSLIGKL